MPDETDFTRLLQDIDRGRAGATEELMDVVYSDLERMAHGYMSQRFGPGLPGVTLEPAALVNESYLKLIKQREKFDNRGHFFAVATKLMMRVLLDYERGRRASKRGGDLQRVTLRIDEAGAEPSADDAGVELDRLVDALERLASLDERKADVVKLRVLWGLTLPEIATSLGVSLATVERDWSFSKAFLLKEAQAD